MGLFVTFTWGLICYLFVTFTWGLILSPNSQIAVKALLLCTLFFSFMSIGQNAGDSGRMDKEKSWISPTLANDTRRLECFQLFLILTNQAGQRPRKSVNNTKFSLFSLFCIFSLFLDVSTRLTHFLFFFKTQISHFFHATTKRFG